MDKNALLIKPSIAQVALSVVDLDRSKVWFEELGLIPTGGLEGISGEPFASIIDLPELDTDMKWLVGSEPMMQLELFKFNKPEGKLLIDWSLRRLGYGFVSIVVRDFEEQRRRLSTNGTPSLVCGIDGERSLWVQSPDDVWIELLEKDVLPASPSVKGHDHLASLRAVSLSVGDLETAVSFLADAMGLTRLEDADHEPFNAIPDAILGDVRHRVAVVKGGNVLIRLFQAEGSDVQTRPIGSSIADIGVLNVAIILKDRETYLAYADQIRGGGFAATTEPIMAFEGQGMMYGYDSQSNSLETGFVEPGFEEKFGWHV